MAFLVVVLLQLLITIAKLILISAGLSIVFGMMRVINFAHGEFLMLGGYAAIFSNQAGLNLWLAIFVVAPIAVGLVGAILEFLVIRRLYGRMIDTMLATWGISLALIGAATVLFGNNVTNISPPLGNISIGGHGIDEYSLLLVAVAAGLLLAGWLVLRFTKAGLIARAVMQNREMASSLGFDPSKVYAVTFAIGAAVTGLGGALIAPISGVAPTIGASYIAKAFITVITGGSAILAGTMSAAGALGGINTLANFVLDPVLGEVMLLAAAVVLLRLLPQGITGRFFRRSL